MKRIIALILALVCVLGVVSCADTGKNNNQAEEKKIDIKISEGGKTQFVVVMPGGDTVGETMRALQIFNALGGTATEGLAYKNERIFEDVEGACAIVIGSSSVAISKKAAEKLVNPKDYVILVENNEIAIYSEDTNSMADAVTYFLSCLTGEAGNQTLSIPEYKYQTYEYPFAALKIDGASIKNFTIVIPEDSATDRSKAEAINEWVIENVGVELPIVDAYEAEAEYEILIGNTGRAADTITATLAANEYKAVSGNKKLIIAYKGYGASLVSQVIQALEAKDINLLSISGNDDTYAIFRYDNFADGKLSDELLDNVNPGVLSLLSCCMYYESELQKGIKRGEKWVYSNKSQYVPQSGTFDEMVRSGKVGTNCAMIQAWAYIDMGIITNGKHLYGNLDNGLSQWDNLGKYFAPIATCTAWGGRYEWQALYKKGLVEPGDVFFAHGHTFVYMGDELFMASGHDGKWHSDYSAPTEDGSHAVFETWVVPIRNCGDYGYSVNFQLRLKDDYIPKYYRNSEGKLVINPVYDAASSTMYKEGMKVDTTIQQGVFQ